METGLELAEFFITSSHVISGAFSNTSGDKEVTLVILMFMIELASTTVSVVLLHLVTCRSEFEERVLGTDSRDEAVDCFKIVSEMGDVLLLAIFDSDKLEFCRWTLSVFEKSTDVALESLGNTELFAANDLFNRCDRV